MDDSNETVHFNGCELAKTDYLILRKISKKYFNKPPEKYFENLTEPFEKIYLEIEGKHVVVLDIGGENLREIPEEVNNLIYLRKLCLEEDRISKITNLNLEKLTQLQELHLSRNEINEFENEEMLEKLKKRILVYL